MNEMYKYLQEHSYISENKKSNYQSELSEQRAECIANKYNSLVQDLKQENRKYKEVIDNIKKYIEPLITNRDNQQCYPISWYSKDVLLQILKEVE